MFGNGPADWVDSLADEVTSGGTVTVVDTDGAALLVTITDQSLQGVINAINQTPTRGSRRPRSRQRRAVHAAADRRDLRRRRRVRRRTLADFDLGAANLTSTGHNAEIKVGTFTDHVGHQHIHRRDAGREHRRHQGDHRPVTVSMVGDKGGITDKVQALVDAAIRR